MSRLDTAVTRATDRVGRVLDAIEAGDTEGTNKAIKEIELAQPWDIVNIGNAFVLDTSDEWEAEDEKTRSALNL